MDKLEEFCKNVLESKKYRHGCTYKVDDFKVFIKVINEATKTVEVRKITKEDTKEYIYQNDTLTAK